MENRGTGWFPGKKRAKERRACLDDRQGMTKFPFLFISCFLVLSSHLLPGVTLAAETLDRLFFTPQNRDYLEKLRWITPESRPPQQEHKETTEATETKPQVFILGGMVTKKNGVQAMWLNSLKYNGTDLPTNVELRPPFIAGQILLQVPETGSSYALRPGQSVDIGDGQIKESYQRAPVTSATDSKTVPKSAPLTEAASKPPPPPVQVLGVPPPLKP
jgi:hypothetical protein